MIPIVATLLTEGLSLIGNAVLAKGKDWVKQETGVDLDAGKLTNEQIATLKKYEMEHEERLMELRLEEDKLSIEQYKAETESFKIETEDRDSARDRDKTFINMGKHNYRADLMFILAVVLIVFMVYIVWQDESINEYAKGIFTLVLGRFLGYLDNIYNFEFGTTRGSQNKDETIKHLSRDSK